MKIKVKWWHLGLLFSLGLVLVAPMASLLPDGLERVAIDTGFADRGREPPFQLAPDYVFSFAGDETTGLLLGGLAGTAMIFGLVFGLGWLLRRRAS
ncbi:MAG: hypothetical protein HY673_22695 [Chloroflexi bacterium]|nr:hypothetical protein [Chloroflexota bacterium]